MWLYTILFILSDFTYSLYLFFFVESLPSYGFPLHILLSDVNVLNVFL